MLPQYCYARLVEMWHRRVGELITIAVPSIELDHASGLQGLQPLMENIAGTTAASLDALCTQYLHYWRQARLDPVPERRGSVIAGKPDKQADAAPAVPSVKQTIKIANLADFINRIEQQIRSINELKDSVSAALPCIHASADRNHHQRNRNVIHLGAWLGFTQKESCRAGIPRCAPVGVCYKDTTYRCCLPSCAHEHLRLSRVDGHQHGHIDRSPTSRPRLPPADQIAWHLSNELWTCTAFDHHGGSESMSVIPRCGCCRRTLVS